MQIEAVDTAKVASKGLGLSKWTMATLTKTITPSKMMLIQRMVSGSSLIMLSLAFLALLILCTDCNNADCKNVGNLPSIESATLSLISFCKRADVPS